MPPPLRHMDAPTLWPKVVGSSLLLHAAAIGLVWHLTHSTQPAVIPISILAPTDADISAPNGSSTGDSPNVTAPSEADPSDTSGGTDGPRSDSSAAVPSETPARQADGSPSTASGPGQPVAPDDANSGDSSPDGPSAGATTGNNPGTDSDSDSTPGSPATPGEPGRPNGITVSFSVEAVSPDLLSQPLLDQAARPNPMALNLDLSPEQTVVQTPRGDRCPVSETAWGSLGTPVPMRITVTQAGDFFDSGIDRASLNSYEQLALCLVEGWTYTPAQKQGQPVFSDEQQISVIISGQSP